MMKTATALVLVSLLFPLAASAESGTLSADDLMLVDCRLPAKQRRIGNRTYPVAGRTVRTTAVDCRIRGGEYTVYDRANYQTSLKVWLDAAAKGDHDAEYYVGKIYEGGLGTDPDYGAAAQWYEKAAAAGHTASQYALATLYDRGLGVTADKAKAINLYRTAAGLPANLIIVDAGQYEALQKAANDLAVVEEKVKELTNQLEDARKREKSEQEKLQRQLDDARKQADAQKSDLTRLESALKNAGVNTKAATVVKPPKGGLGKYYALVIGNSRYASLPAVPNAESDAKAMASTLRDLYGFDVTLLLNAGNAQILSSLYQLSRKLGAGDNLVVYYAGHGKRDLRNRRGWWLPVDAGASAESKTNWIPNQEVSDRLALIAARHILVLADASYVGDITRGAPQPETLNMTAGQWAKYVDSAQQRRARLALSSGSDDAEGSRFTAALIDALKKQQGVVPASRIHREVVNTLTSDARGSSAVPTFAPLQSAFHEGVDFLFQRK